MKIKNTRNVFLTSDIASEYDTYYRTETGKTVDNIEKKIVSITMLEFVDDLEKVLNETDRVLKPGGTLVLGCLNALSEPGKNKNNDPVFQHARFFTPNEITEMLARFGNPHISAGVYFSPDFEILDGTEKQSTAEPAFIAASVQKQK